MSIIDAISKPFHDFWIALLALVVKILTALLTMFHDVFLWIIEQLLSLVAFILSGLNMSFLTAALPTFELIPDSMSNVLGLLGIGQCLAVIGGAIVIRVALQLIPFVRLGS